MTIRILMKYHQLTQAKFLLHLSFFFFPLFSSFSFSLSLPLSFRVEMLDVQKFKTSAKESAWMPNSGCVPYIFFVFLSVSSFFLTQVLTSRKNKGGGGDKYLVCILLRNNYNSLRWFISGNEEHLFLSNFWTVREFLYAETGMPALQQEVVWI